MPEQLRVFVASSTEQLDAAKSVCRALRRNKSLSVHLWEEDVFDFSAAYIESLEQELDRADFLVAVLTGDDVAKMRKVKRRIPRDNVTFELGLFVGRLGRPRCFFFVDGDSDTHIASDLEGVKPVKFYETLKSADVKRRTLTEQARKVAEQMVREGARFKPTPQIRSLQDELFQFSRAFEGHWWERMRTGDDEGTALSYVTVTTDSITNSPRFQGIVFGRRGVQLASWQTIIAGAQQDDGWQVFYRWEGQHDDKTGQTMGGGGQIIFADDALRSASGFYYDTNYANLPKARTTRIKRFVMLRATAAETKAMRDHRTPRGRSLILRKMREMKWS